jgi:hypothetical protein
MSRASLQRRLLLGAIAWIVLALVATGVLLSVLFRAHLEKELARRLDADFLQLVSQLDVTADGGLTHARTMSDPLYQRVLSGHYWQVDRDGRPLLRSRSLWEQSLAVDAGSGALQRIDGPRGMPLLAVVRHVTLPRVHAPLRLSVAASLAPVENAVAAFRRLMAIALGVLALGLALAAALQIRLGLQPLRRLRGELGAIRSARRTLVGRLPGRSRAAGRGSEQRAGPQCDADRARAVRPAISRMRSRRRCRWSPTKRRACSAAATASVARVCNRKSTPCSVRSTGIWPARASPGRGVPARRPRSRRCSNACSAPCSACTASAAW